MPGDIQQQVHRGVREGLKEAMDRVGIPEIRKHLKRISEDLRIIAEELKERREDPEK